MLCVRKRYQPLTCPWDGANECEEHIISISNRPHILNTFIADLRRVFAQPNPNWQNTAVAERTFTDQCTNHQVQITTGEIARERHDGRRGPPAPSQ